MFVSHVREAEPGNIMAEGRRNGRETYKVIKANSSFNALLLRLVNEAICLRVQD